MDRHEVFELGITEIVGTDDTAIAQYQWSKSTALTISADAVCGYIDALLIVFSGGDELQPTGKVAFFDANPTIASGDANITIAEAKTCIGWVDIASTDWFKEGGGTQVACIAYERLTDPLPFHHLTTLYVAFNNTLATSINSDAADNEVMHLNLWYRKAS